jgi:hypothetical protein
MLNTALITASLHPVLLIAPLRMLSPAALNPSPQFLPPSEPLPESLPPTPPSPTLDLPLALASPFLSSPTSSLLPVRRRRCLQSAAVFRPGTSPSPVLITTSPPLPLAAPSPHPSEAVSAATRRLNIKTSTTNFLDKVGEATHSETTSMPEKTQPTQNLPPRSAPPNVSKYNAPQSTRVSSLTPATSMLNGEDLIAMDRRRLSAKATHPFLLLARDAPIRR